MELLLFLPLSFAYNLGRWPVLFRNNLFCLDMVVSEKRKMTHFIGNRSKEMRLPPMICLDAWPLTWKRL
jgi:hypothetical protein